MNQEQLNLIEELKSGRAVNSKPFEVPLTILIMTYNDASWLSLCLEPLRKQNIIPDIIIYDCGSKDGTVEMIETQIKTDYHYPAKINLIKEDLNYMGKNARKIYVRKKVCEMIDTKYIMFLTPTIQIPAFSIRKLLDELNKDERLAIIGIRSRFDIPHIQLNCSVLKTEQARQIEWNKFQECNCRNVREQFIMNGYKMKQHDTLTALHLPSIL